MEDRAVGDPAHDVETDVWRLSIFLPSLMFLHFTHRCATTGDAAGIEKEDLSLEIGKE